MSRDSLSYGDIKRKLRELKKLEIKIRFGGNPAQEPDARLVWDAFFDLRERKGKRAKYSLSALAAMDRDAFRVVVEEFFLRVYGTLRQEFGTPNSQVYDPETLFELGLPPDADEPAVKKRFHELALRYHPDTGGDAGRFMELMTGYRRLIGKGK